MTLSFEVPKRIIYTYYIILLKAGKKLKIEDKKENLSRIYMELADHIGFENAAIIHREYGGQQINFPLNFYSREYTHSQILNEFDGTNAKQLAAKYNCSERTVRRVLDKEFKL